MGPKAHRSQWAGRVGRIPGPATAHHAPPSPYRSLRGGRSESAAGRFDDTNLTTTQPNEQKLEQKQAVQVLPLSTMANVCRIGPPQNSHLVGLITASYSPSGEPVRERHVTTFPFTIRSKGRPGDLRSAIRRRGPRPWCRRGTTYRRPSRRVGRRFRSVRPCEQYRRYRVCRPGRAVGPGPPGAGTLRV